MMLHDWFAMKVTGWLHCLGLFKLAPYTELFFSLFLFQKMYLKKKKKTWQPNVVLSEFLIMYSFGDFKFDSLYF